MANKPGRKTPEVDGYLTAAQMADLLQVSLRTIYRASGRKMPPLREVLGSKRFLASEVAAWQQAGHVWPLPTPAAGKE